MSVKRRWQILQSLQRVMLRGGDRAIDDSTPMADWSSYIAGADSAARNGPSHPLHGVNLVRHHALWSRYCLSAVRPDSQEASIGLTAENSPFSSAKEADDASEAHHSDD